METVDFTLARLSTVRIIELNRCGTVDALELCEDGQLFRVVYWNNGDRKVEWMYAWELEEVQG